MGYHDDHDNDYGHDRYNDHDDHCSNSWESHTHAPGDDPDEPYSWFEGHPPQQQQSRRRGRSSFSGGSHSDYSRYSSNGGCLIFVVAVPAIAVILAMMAF